MITRRTSFLLGKVVTQYRELLFLCSTYLRTLIQGKTYKNCNAQVQDVLIMQLVFQSREKISPASSCALLLPFVNHLITQRTSEANSTLSYWLHSTAPTVWSPFYLPSLHCKVRISSLVSFHICT